MGGFDTRKWNTKVFAVALAFVVLACSVAVLVNSLALRWISSPSRIDPSQVEDEIVTVRQSEVWRLNDEELDQLMFQAEVRGDADAAYRAWHHLMLFGNDSNAADVDADRWGRLAAELGHEGARIYFEQKEQAESETPEKSNGLSPSDD